MSDKRPGIADVKAKHFEVIIDDLESSSKEHGVHPQNSDSLLCVPMKKKSK